jgi:signal transduction histidine kinase
VGIPTGTRADRADALLAAVLAALGLFSLVPYSDEQLRGASAPYAVAAVVLLCAPIALRRRAPRLTLALVTLGVAAFWLGGPRDTVTALAGSVAIYSVGRHVERPASIRAFGGCAAVLAGVAGWLALASDEGSAGAVFLARCAVIAGAFWLGDSQRSRVTLIELLREQARRAETEHLDAERRAVLEERGRISRELHDVVAHALSVIVIQATVASRLVGRDEARASEAIEHVAETGRTALTEMRNVLGRLHADDAGADPQARDATPEYAPLPTLADLDALVERCRAVGVVVTVERDPGLPPLTAGAELSVVRVVQEALTNVMKHSPNAHAVVRLRAGSAGPDEGAPAVVVEVVDDGAGRGAGAAPSDGRGRGLIGMRERVEALGGTFRAGPASGGGFSVRAVVPAGGRS